MAYEDPYVVLGLQRGASKKEVQQAFRELALKHHPDRDPSFQAAQRFQAISRAATSILKEAGQAQYHASVSIELIVSMLPVLFTSLHHCTPAHLQGSKAPASEAAAARRRWQEQHQSSSQQWVRAAR